MAVVGRAIVATVNPVRRATAEAAAPTVAGSRPGAWMTRLRARSRLRRSTARTPRVTMAPPAVEPDERFGPTRTCVFEPRGRAWRVSALSLSRRFRPDEMRLVLRPAEFSAWAELREEGLAAGERADDRREEPRADDLEAADRDADDLERSVRRCDEREAAGLEEREEDGRTRRGPGLPGWTAAETRRAASRLAQRRLLPRLPQAAGARLRLSGWRLAWLASDASSECVSNHLSANAVPTRIPRAEQ